VIKILSASNLLDYHLPEIKELSNIALIIVSYLDKVPSIHESLSGFYFEPHISEISLMPKPD
jgi:hypothetical protein